ncbi:VOC family protein [Lactococcus lactis]|uniref:VOC family protein n=1 Tax=Lactococcus lactis TaxID=1358 RepID=UPI001BAADD94|nr:VOC family protein [Lactococcus lactis]MBR8678338.1 glyoxalase [Lactococcus lactis subsp. lactis]MBR8681233.1 glyoxalase [Lactococcus lactis subsp. lactis]MBR8686357.1 glyoxalase [Lactococcus lactis subsp. lactis]MDT3324482.1 VOC family protein [Bacillota bacterium]
MDTKPFIIKKITLRASNISVMRNFYENLLQFHVISETDSSVSYAFRENEEAFLTLEFRGRLRKKNTAGLFHYAILFPDASSKATIVDRIIKNNYPIGAGDHLVSESFYINDPEGNGIELYHDRDSTEWIWEDGKVKMGTLPVDVQALLDQKNNHLDYPKNMKIGHLHFTGNSIAKSDEFFYELLNTDLVSFIGDTAHFYSQNHYHHHFATNIWEGENINKRNLLENGILKWELEVSKDYYDSISQRIIEKGIPFKDDENSISIEDHVGSKFILFKKI